LVEQRSPKPLVAGSNPATPARGIEDGIYRAGINSGWCPFPAYKAGNNQRLLLGLFLAGYFNNTGHEFPVGTEPNEGMAPSLVAAG
jgi:hypothetical protein